MADAWGLGTYERLAARFGPVQAELLERLRVAPGEDVLDLATGAGQLALGAARIGAQVSALDQDEALVGLARERAAGDSLDVAFQQGDLEYLPYDDRSFDVLVSNFGFIFAPDHANVAAELARVARPGARLGFTEEPIEGREAYEWGREDHVEDMLGEEFELEYDDGTLWLEAESGEEIWSLFSESAPPVISLVRRLSPADADEFHRAFVELYESYREDDGGIRAPRRYLLVLGTRK